MAESPLRPPRAVDRSMLRRSSGPLERMWHPLVVSAIGIDARQGRDPVLRGSVRSMRARPPRRGIAHHQHAHGSTRDRGGIGAFGHLRDDALDVASYDRVGEWSEPETVAFHPTTLAGPQRLLH